MENLSITGLFLSLIGKSRPKNGFSIIQYIDLKANAIFVVCNRLLINVELCAVTIKGVPKMGDPLALLTSEQRGRYD